jgi:transposase
MVTDNQVRRLMKLINEEKTLAVAAAKAGMDEKTARKWRNLGKLPSETRPEHNWRTRKDPFEDVWEEIRRKLEINPGLEAKTLFEDLQRRYPGSFADGQLRTLQRKVKIWRALEGAAKEAFFPQEHVPGKLCESDFTHMTSLRVTIAGAPFPHLIYHFVLPYSNWETGTICFSECFESLSTGLQNALFELGAVPAEHRTDRLSTAVGKVKHPEEFTRRYRALLSHYGLTGKATNARSPNENGDVEQSHYRFKRAVDQALMLRGSRDFESRGDYAAFLKKIFSQLNAGRCVRFVSELKVLKTLPRRRLDTSERLRLRVGPSSTVRIRHNTYSVPSRFIGETIDVCIHAEIIEIIYAQKIIETIPRLRGEEKQAINYRHIIDSLVRKPGAFANYRYREDLFPTTRFRIAYDILKKQKLSRADKAYLSILYLAAYEGEAKVDCALKSLIDEESPITKETVGRLISENKQAMPKDVFIADIDLSIYDWFFTEAVV